MSPDKNLVKQLKPVIVGEVVSYQESTWNTAVYQVTSYFIACCSPGRLQYPKLLQFTNVNFRTTYLQLKLKMQYLGF